MGWGSFKKKLKKSLSNPRTHLGALTGGPSSVLVANRKESLSKDKRKIVRAHVKGLSYGGEWAAVGEAYKERSEQDKDTSVAVEPVEQGVLTTGEEGVRSGAMMRSGKKKGARYLSVTSRSKYRAAANALGSQGQTLG
jgi:hypothetical protein